MLAKENPIPDSIAFFGGAFDPVHNDHLRIACECYHYGYAREIWFLPSPDRWDKKMIAPVSARIEMLKSAVKPYPFLKVCDWEANETEFLGTYLFLKKAQLKLPETELRWIIGADTYEGIPRWRDPRKGETGLNGVEMLKEFSLIVFPRNGYMMPDRQAHSEKGYRPLFDFTETQSLRFIPGSISSTEIRQRVKQDKHYGFVPESVLQDIKKWYSSTDTL